MDALLHARGKTVDALYTYIYFQAWNNLSEEERTTFLCMPLVAHNLVNSNQATNEEELRYSIHNLTRTFLHEQIAKWTM
ncbi:hypothetical protein KFU94_39810 [Chloroflexi bacterium TSY]|nr:hypothetical protein [Chloroflexi bacterium TSY]